MYFEARYYDPLSARFISPDPLFAAEMEKCIESIVECNLYQYTGNNPVNWFDILGLEKGEFSLSNFSRAASNEWTATTFEPSFDISNTTISTSNKRSTPLLDATLSGTGQGIKVSNMSGNEVVVNIITGESNSYTFSGIEVDAKAGVLTSGGTSKVKFNDRTGVSSLNDSLDLGLSISTGKNKSLSIKFSSDLNGGGSSISGNYSNRGNAITIETRPEVNVGNNISKFINYIDYMFSSDFIVDNFDSR
jgi:RHS repeat-associated protein